MSEFRDVAARCRSDLMTADATSRILLDNGASPVESIRIIRDVFAIGLGEAKVTVHRNLSREQQSAAESLWDAAEAALNTD